MTLSKAVDIYIRTKREQGFDYDLAGAILNRFVRHVGDKHLSRISQAQVDSFLSNGGTCHVNTWVKRYRLVRAFLEHWRLRGQITTLPMPPARREMPRTFLPYIYTRSELRGILRATATAPWRLTRATSVDPITLRTFLLLLYGTGILLNEALALRRSDVDLRKDLVTLHRLGRSRCIPIGRDVHVLLSDYVKSRARRGDDTSLFFVNVGGKPIGYKALWYQYYRVCRRAGVVRRDGGRYHARICDLRFTFLVHRLTSWFKEGTDVERMLIPLSEYMGMTGSDSLEKYLAMTPERFRKQLRALSLRTNHER